MRKLNALEQDVADELFKSMLPQIISLCRNWVRKCNRDFDELMSHAQEVFVNYFIEYDPDKGERAPWIFQHIKWKFHDDLRRQMYRKRTGTDTVYMDLTYCAIYSTDPLKAREEFEGKLAGLADDAQYVVKLALKEDGATLTTLRQRLRSERWPHNRISEAFREIKQTI